MLLSSLCYEGDIISSGCHIRCCLHSFVSSDHLTVSVAIKVNGTSVVSGSFIIYDCERTGKIHPKTPWVTLLISLWFISNSWFNQLVMRLHAVTFALMQWWNLHFLKYCTIFRKYSLYYFIFIPPLHSLCNPLHFNFHQI